MNEVSFTLSFCKFCGGEGCFSIFGNKNFKFYSGYSEFPYSHVKKSESKIAKEKSFYPLHLNYGTMIRTAIFILNLIEIRKNDTIAWYCNEYIKIQTRKRSTGI